MFRNKQLDRIENRLVRMEERFALDVIEIRDLYKQIVAEKIKNMFPVSPAKKPAKRKYVKSGKYAKVTTKKK